MLTKIVKFFSSRHIDFLLIFILAALYYGQLQWPAYIGDPDGFYHAKIALFLKEGTLLHRLPWMYFSTLRDNFTDQHFLYHLLLVPFTFFKNPLIGIKIASVFFASLMATSFYWLLKKIKIDYPFIFSPLLLTLFSLSFRLSLIKANSLSLILIWLLLYALLQYRLMLIFAVAFTFVWLYGGWPLAIIITAAFSAATWLHQKFIAQHKIKLKPHYYGRLWLTLTAGLSAGLVINPYWPENLYFYYQQLIQIGIINYGQQFAVGNEWYGASLSQIASSSPHLLFIAVALTVILFFNLAIVSRRTIFSFSLAFGFLILTMKSARYGEYFLPLTLFFVACASTDLIKKIILLDLNKTWQQLNQSLKMAFLGLLSLGLIIISYFILVETIQVKLPTKFPLAKFTAANVWLKNNTPPNSIVWHNEWSDWPLLFYHNTHNYFIIGLDPTFLHNYDANLNILYTKIGKAEISNIPPEIKDKFNADFILVRTSANQTLLDQLKTDPQIDLRYSDNEALIYEIK